MRGELRAGQIIVWTSQSRVDNLIYTCQWVALIDY